MYDGRRMVKIIISYQIVYLFELPFIIVLSCLAYLLVF